MADEGYGRTFVGDPNPPPRPIEAPAAVSPPSEESAGGATHPATPAASSTPSKVRFKAVDVGDGFDLYAATDEDSAIPLGKTSVTGIGDIFRASGAYYNESAKVWEDIPQHVIDDVKRNDLPIDKYVPARYRAAKADIARSLVYNDWMGGKISLDDARGRGDLELLKAQIKEDPIFAWQGDLPKTISKMWKDTWDAGIIGASRRAAGEVAGQVAVQTDAPMAAAFGLSIGAAFVTPGTGALAPTLLAGALETGAGALVFRRSYQIEGGSTAAEMDKKGYDEATIKKYAPVAGVIKGVLEVVSFRMLPAPFKRVIFGKALASGAVRKVMTKAYVSYMKEMGTEVATEEAQTLVDLVANNMAAEAENKPEKLVGLTSPEALNEYVNTGLVTAIATGGMKLPGFALEAGVQKFDARKEAKAQAATTAKVEEYKKTAAAEPVVAPAEPKVEAPAVAPAEPRVEAAVTEHVKTPEDIDTAKAVVEEVTAAAEAKPTPRVEMTLEERTREVERKGRVAELRKKLEVVERDITEIEADRQTRIVAGKTTAHLDSRLDSLVNEGTALRAEIGFHEAGPLVQPTPTAVERTEDISMKAATLEDIVAAGFKEGGKESRTRARELLASAQEMGLTKADVNKILKNKVLGTMGPVEFKNYVEDFTARAEQVAARKEKEVELRTTIKERNIKKADNIRRLLELPKVSEMDDAQLQQFIDTVKTYDENSTALSPKRTKVHAVTGGLFKGVKTEQEVVKRAAEIIGAPAESLLTPDALKVGEFDVNRGEEALRDRGPIIKFGVRLVHEGRKEVQAWYQATHEHETKLFAKALASRRKLMGAGEHVADWFAPQQKLMMSYLEEQDPVKRAALRGQLAPAEVEYVDFYSDAMQQFEDHLIKVQGLESAYSGAYVPHFRRPLLEMVRDLPETGFKKFVEELVRRHKVVTDTVMPDTRKDQALGLLKSFTNTLHREGGLIPSKNLHAGFEKYSHMFYTKVALDKAISAADTLMLALRTVDKTEKHEATKAMAAFFKELLNAKKGNAEWVVKQRGIAEAYLRTSQSLAALWYISGNLKLQVASRAGEYATDYLSNGALAMGRAEALALTKDGRTFIKNLEGHIGESPVTRFFEPGTPLMDRLNILLSGSFQHARRQTMIHTFLGNATDAEVKAGKLSTARIADLEEIASRWIDIHGMKSVRGSSVAGATVTQFKGWAIPPARTLAKDLVAWSKKVAHPTDPKYNLTRLELLDFQRLTTLSILTGWLAYQDLKKDKEDDSFLRQLKLRAIREMATPWQALMAVAQIAAGATLGVGPALMGKLAADTAKLLIIIGDREKDETDVKKQLRRMSPAGVKLLVPPIED